MSEYISDKTIGINVEFKEIAERSVETLIKEGLVKEDCTIYELAKIIRDTINVLDLKSLSDYKAIGVSFILVYIDYIYSLREWKEIDKPHVTIEWLVGEAYNMYKHAYLRVNKNEV